MRLANRQLANRLSNIRPKSGIQFARGVAPESESGNGIRNLSRSRSFYLRAGGDMRKAVAFMLAKLLDDPAPTRRIAEAALDEAPAAWRAPPPPPPREPNGRAIRARRPQRAVGNPGPS